LEVSTASGRFLAAVIAIDIVVVVTVGHHEENLLNASAAELKLLDTEAHAGGDRGTAAAARLSHVGAGSAANEVVNRGLHIGISDTLSHGESSPGGSVEVDKGEVGAKRSIGESRGETSDERLLVGELSLGDRARSVKNDGNVNRLTALAARGRGEDTSSGRNR
jgi:hypothetical protein